MEVDGCVLIARIKKSDISINISPIYQISVVGEAKFVIDNRLNEVSIKYIKYRRYIDRQLIYRGDIEHA